jgi:hypothetical protein
LKAQTLDVGPHVQNNVKNNEKKPGGITGKGFRPGQSGNPGGRPKKRPITERYAIIAELPLPERLRRKYRLPLGVTWGDAGGFGAFEAMVKGHWGAAKEIREALEGKSTQRVELTGESGGPVTTKLDLPSTLAAIREFYGLSPNPNQPAEDSMPPTDVPASTAAVARPEPKKTSDEK